MPDNVIIPTAASPDITGWIAAGLLAVLVVILFLKIVKIGKRKKSEFDDFEDCRRLNEQEGYDRWVFLLVLDVNGRMIDTYRAERFEGALYRRSGAKLWTLEGGPSLWTFSGVPCCIVWGDKYRATSPEVDEAIIKAMIPEKGEDGKKLSKEDIAKKMEVTGWHELKEAFAAENPRYNEQETCAPWHVVDFASMAARVPSTSPSLLYSLIEHLTDVTETKKKGGILQWIMDHKMIVIIGVIAVVAVFMFLPK